MRLFVKRFGWCYLNLSHGRISCVDTFVESAFSDLLDRALTDKELDYLQEKHSDEIQFYSYSEGYTPNHN